MSNLSLMSIMREDPGFGQRLEKKAQAIKEDKQHLLSVADKYGEQYQEEIIRGTELRAKLLTEGAAKGMTEAEVMESHGKFMPTVYTPILNLLYFLLRESEKQDNRKYRQRDAINEALIKAKQLSHDDQERDLTADELTSILEEKFREVHEQTLAEDKRQAFNTTVSTEEREDAELKDAPDMVEYLYGKITLDTFNKIKKLKALSTSPNEAEAFQAYRKALELCKENNLEFDKIPCYVKKEPTV